MRIADHLSKEQKQQLNKLKVQSPKKKQQKKIKKRKQERVNWPEIMGINRDTYIRKNGAVRRK